MAELPSRYSVSPLGGLDIGTKLENIIAGGKQQYRMKQWQETAPDIIKGGNPDEIANLMIKFPEMQPQIVAATGHKDEAMLKKSMGLSKSILTGAGDPKQLLAQFIQEGQARGEDVSKYMNVLGKELQNPGAAKQWSEKWYALTDPGGFNAYSKTIAPEKTSDISVGAQEILEDGTIIQSTSTGPVVYNPEGEKVTGRDAADAVKQARAQKVSNLRSAAGEKKAASLESEMLLKGAVEANIIGAKEAAKISVSAFDRLEKINKNISNIDEAITLIDQGAETGVIDKMLPSIRTASIKLNNLQGRLGLDVLASTTFGALSASELKFALNTALPVGLQPQELKQWLIDKKAAQEKLSDYLEASAIYLGTPGNTVKGWMELQRNKRASGLPPGVTEDQVKATMQKYGHTREQVLSNLKKAGR